MSALPMTNARREQQQKARLSVSMTAATTGDEDACRKAVMNVVQVWLDRLQLISTITTFFAGIDSTILSFALSLTHAANTDYHEWTNTLRVLTASLVGALIFHICAAMTSFVASFVLIRYRLIDMKDHLPPLAASETTSPLGDDRPGAPSRFKSAPGAIESTHSKDSTSATHVNSIPLKPQISKIAVEELLELASNVADTVSQLEGRVFIHQVQPFLFSWFHRRSEKPLPSNGMHLDPPIRLLSRCHTLSVTMALLGFVLALLGIVAFAWVALPLSVSIFCSVCLGTCLGGVFMIFSVT